MRSSFRFWLAVSLMLVAGAIVIWLKSRPNPSTEHFAWAQPQPVAARESALLSAPSVVAAQRTAETPKKRQNSETLAERFQLSNVALSQDMRKALTRVETAILMRNALIDTRQPIELSIPVDLRANGNPGAYIVQSKEVSTVAFQNMLKEAGAEIVAYVPNNAFLVKAEGGVAGVLEGRAEVQAVLPYEPYYKLDMRLMRFAVDQEPMADDAWLRVTLFPGGSEKTLERFASVMGQKERSPFGEQVLIQPRAGALASLAQLAEVQIIEPWTPRVAANDLTRVALGVSTDTTTNENHFGLSGNNVWVNVNDIGVDATHPALQGKVFYHGNNAKTDFDGHGTHVAATIAGKPATSIFDNLDALPTNSLRTNYVIVTDDEGVATTNFFIDGSRTNADFRGIAHNAKLFILPIDFQPDVNQPVTDTYIIETAARTNYFTIERTNTLISNNSWSYANATDYDSQAARFDAATRDALPSATNSQPVLFVFAAGNQGFGAEDGTVGEPGSIASPGTAKNVITVGALEQPRFIAESLTNIETRTEVDDEGVTNTVTVTNLTQIFRPSTDSANEVASFSSRGNVGIGVEGAFGRFKPDLVAPGTFIWSARSTNWNLTNDFNPADTNLFDIYNTLSNLNAVSSKYRYDSGTSFSAPGVSGLLALVQEFFSQKLPADRRRDLSPALMKALLINAARSANSIYDYDPRGRINYQGWGLVDLRNIISVADDGRPTLEVMTEKEWPIQLIEQSPTNAIATGEERVWNITFHTNALALPLRFTLVWTDPPGNPQVGVKLVNDLDLTVEAGNSVFFGNDIVSGSTSTEQREPRPAGEWPLDNPFRDNLNNVEQVLVAVPKNVKNSDGTQATNFTVRVSGRRVNVKAVNDYYDVTGRTNEIVQDFALVISADNNFITNAFTKFERVKDVTVNTNVLVQPIYNGVEATNQRAGANSPLYWTNGNSVQWRMYVFTNNDAALNAGFAMEGLHAGSNVAFITSAAINIGNPRNVEPDIDLYVSKDPLLTNLNPAAVATAWRSTTRLGTEQVVFVPSEFVLDKDGNETTNRVDQYNPAHTDEGGAIVGQVALDDVFYVAVKSEDQQAADFSLIAISTDLPFEEDRNGIRVIHLLPAPAAVPDGTAALPRGRRYFGVPLRNGRIADASMYIAVEHEEFGDLVGVLGHGARYADLFSHSLPAGFTNAQWAVYSDYPFARMPLDLVNEYPPSEYLIKPYPPGGPLLVRSDGPRFLSTYSGAKAQGAWTFDAFDSAASHTGLVYQAEVHVLPLKQQLISGETVTGTLAANSQVFYPLDVPNDATKVTLTLTITSGTASTNIALLVRKDLLPSTNAFDYFGTFTNGATNITVSFDRNSEPPLIPGEYIVGLVNLGGSSIEYALTVTIETDENGFKDVLGNPNVPLADDARTLSEDFFPDDRIVTEAAVAIVSEQARVSDIVLRLTSPQGTSVILSENRGWLDPNGFGSTVPTPTFPGPSYAVFTDTLGLPIKFTPPPFGDSATNRGFIFGNSFEGALEGTYNVNAIFDGWRVISNSVHVVYGEAADGFMYANLGDEGLIQRTIPTIKGRPYKLSFAYRGRTPITLGPSSTRDFAVLTNQPARGPVFGTGQTVGPDGLHTNAPLLTVDHHYRLINNPDINFPPPPGQDGSTMFIVDTNSPPFPAWFRNDTNSQWIALKPQNDDGHPAGTYTNRTSFINSEDPARVRILARIAADQGPVPVRVNGVLDSTVTVDPNGYSFGFILNGAGTPIRKGLNTIDFIVPNNGVGPVGFRAHLMMTLATNVQVQVPSTTNAPWVGFMRLFGAEETNVFSVTGTSEWQRFETEFIADKNDIVLQFYAGAAFWGVDIDDVVLEDTGTKFMHPEEDLAILEGERAMGEWKLEALDNRTGAVIPSAIVDWQLILGTAASPRLAEQLGAGANYPARINNPVIRAGTNIYTPGRIIGGETEWFYFDVCPNATQTTIELFTPSTNSIPLELLVDRSGFPTGDPNTDDYAIIRTRPETNSTVRLQLTLTNPAAAPLRPGKRLFIAVRGATFPLTTNETFLLRILPNGCPQPPPMVLNVNEALSTAAFAAAEGDEGTIYQASTAGAASVKVAAQGELVILASNGVEPTPENYQMRQTVSGGTATLTLPSGGTWFLRVINESGETIPYTIAVAEGASNIRSVTIVGGKLKVTWESVPGTSYEIASSTDLINWTPLTTVEAGSTETTYTTETGVDGLARFIRIRLL